MSNLILTRLINFVANLKDNNPYQSTADHLESLLLPCPLPSWSLYVKYFLLVEFAIMFAQSSYLLYVRSKTKKVYHIGLNDMSLIQLDRANHCGLCYLLYSSVAVLEMISQSLVQSGHLDQGWPDFILGIQFTLTYVCAGVILWLAICHCLSVKGYNLRRSTTAQPFLSKTAVWAMNVSLVVAIIVPMVIIIFSFYQLAMEYHRIKRLVQPLVNAFRQKDCSVGTCNVAQMLLQVLSLTSALPHVDVLVHYMRLGGISYSLCHGYIVVIYVPVLYRLFQSFRAQRRLFRSSQPQQDKVFANTLIEFVIVFVMFLLSVHSVTFIQEGEFIYNPAFFLNLRITGNGVISNLGNIALFLIVRSHRSTDVEPPKVHIPILPFSPGCQKSDVNTSPCYPYL